LKGTVINVVHRQCPVSVGLGRAFESEAEDDKAIEVHLARTKFVKSFDLILNEGDRLRW
jgi:hypothetical protein